MVVEEAVDFEAEAEDIKDAEEEADLADVAELDLFMTMEEEEVIVAVDKILEWCNVMMDHSWRFVRVDPCVGQTGAGGRCTLPAWGH